MKQRKLMLRSGHLAAPAMPMVLALAIGLGASAFAQSSYTWNGGGGDGNWGTGANWIGSSAPGSLQSYLNFAGSTRLNSTNNYPDYSGGFQIWFNSGAGSFSLYGNHLKFYDYGGGQPVIENDSSNPQTVNFGFGVGASSSTTAIYLNPAAGDLTFGGNFSYFDDQGVPLTINSGNGHTVNFNGPVGNGGASARFVLAQNSIVVFNAGNTYTGETDINAGELRIGSGGAISSSSSIYLGNGGTLTTTAQLTLAAAGGGQTFGNNFTVNNSSGGQYRVIAGGNTSGTNTYTGDITLNGDASHRTKCRRRAQFFRASHHFAKQVRQHAGSRHGAVERQW